MAIPEPFFYLIHSSTFRFFLKKSRFFAFFERTKNVRAEFLPPTQRSSPPASPQLPPLTAQSSQRSYEAMEKSQTANQLSSTREDLGSNFIRQTIIWQVDYNSFFDTYSLRWRHQYITIFKVKYSFCSYFSRKNFVYLDFSLKRSVTRVLHVTIKSSDIFASIFSFEFLNIITK